MTDSKTTDFIFDKPPNYDNAYVWLIMKGDAYLPGLFNSIYSVMRTDALADLVVMVTDDVSERCIDLLSKVATHIARVPYLRFKSKKLKTDKQDKMYSGWMDVSYTKWNMLALPYKKVIFVDGDTLELDNLDSLFELSAPAGPFNSPFGKPVGYIKDYLPRTDRTKDGYFKHGIKIPSANIMDALNKEGVVLTANCVLLAPSLSDYKLFLNMMNSYEATGFGFNNYSASDEQSIVYFYTTVKKQLWTNIYQTYNYIGWKKGHLAPGVVPYILHYFNVVKPWVMKWNEYPDVVVWWKFLGEAVAFAKIDANDLYVGITYHKTDKSGKKIEGDKIDAVKNIELATNAPDKYIQEFNKKIHDSLHLIGKIDAINKGRY